MGLEKIRKWDRKLTGIRSDFLFTHESYMALMVRRLVVYLKRLRFWFIKACRYFVSVISDEKARPEPDRVRKGSLSGVRLHVMVSS